MNQAEQIIEQIFTHNDRIGGKEQMINYIYTTFEWLDKRPVGVVITVTDVIKKPENIELFTNIIKLYICSTTTTLSFLRDDYKQFRMNEIVT